ncbi:MAG: FliM/FliN family flagellar motor switch protein [Pirellulaceae bacterium]|nr:FliM/FliN family flagellar motor switch protein [Pirellulaceae bacterium]
MKKEKLTRAEIETLMGVKSSDGSPDAPAAAEEVERIGRALAGALVEFRVELARTRVTAAEVLNLGVGDIITTDQRVDRPLAVEVDGHVAFHVRPGTHEGRKAVRIEKRLDEGERGV